VGKKYSPDFLRFFPPLYPPLLRPPERINALFTGGANGINTNKLAMGSRPAVPSSQARRVASQGRGTERKSK
jgi:hypothetical protein